MSGTGANSSKVQIAFAAIPDATTAPAGQLQALPIKSEGLERTPQIFRDDSLTGRTAMRPGKLTGYDPKGPVDFYLDPAPTWHPLFDAALRTTPIASVQAVDTDISFQASDSSINSVGGALPVVLPGQRIYVHGSADNDGIKKVVSRTANKVVVVETLVDETAGPSITVIVSKLWRNGDEKKYLAVQKGYTDIGVYDHYPACLVESMALSYSGGNNPVGFNVQFRQVGKKHKAGDPLETGVEASSMGTGVDPAPDPELIAPTIDVWALFSGGGEAPYPTKQFSISVANNFSTDSYLQYDGPCYSLGDFVPSGNFEPEFQVASQLEAVRSLSQDELGIAVMDSQRRMLIATVPGAELQSGEPKAGGKNQTITLPISYTGVDTGINYEMQLEYLEIPA